MVAICLTVLSSLVNANFAYFNLSSNISPKNLKAEKTGSSISN